MRRFALALVLLASISVGGQHFGASLLPSAARAVEFEAVIWQFEEDYPGADGDDTKLPVQTVYIKTHDATNWMSTYDRDRSAVHGPASVRRLIDDYNVQGIEVVAWFVPKGGDVDRQVEMAVEVIDSGVKGLYADLEPFDGFCHMDCAYLAEHFWQRVRAERPNANLGVIYDPRPWTFEQSATSAWLSVVNVALPMCYWEDFVDQPPYNDPAGCVSQARTDLGWLAQGTSLEYVPMLQGNTTGERFIAAVDAARAAGSTRVSIWRRGVVTGAVWEAAWNIYEPGVEVAASWPSYWQWSPCPWDGCILREERSSALYVLYSGAKFPIASPDALAAMGRSPGDHWIVGDGAMSMVADVPWDGTLLREAGSEGVFVVYAGAKFPVPSLDVLYTMGLGAQAIHTVPPGSLGRIPSVPRDGARFAEMSGADWQITAGARFHLPSAEVRDALIGLGAMESGVYTVPDGALAAIPLVPSDRSHIRELSSPMEYQIAAGAKFALADAVERNKLVHANQLKWRTSIVPDGALAGLPVSPPDGAWLRELDGDTEWQIAGGTKIRLTDAGGRQALSAAGVLRNEIAVVPSGALAELPEGPGEGALLKEPGSATLFVWRCGSVYRIADAAQLDRLVASGKARLPVLTVAGPLTEPPVRMWPSCGDAHGSVCPKRGWGIGNPFAPAGCRPE